MRLHLPKGLLAAILAACLALPAGAEGETATIQYGWSNGAPATSKDGGTSWELIEYGTGNTLSSFTDYTLYLGSSGGDVKVTDLPVDSVGNTNYCGWGIGFTVSGTAESVWFDTRDASATERIYLSCPDISKMSNVYLNGVHFVVGTGNSSKDTPSNISSNLFLGAGTWSNDSNSVHHKAVLRTNVDASISGNVSLTSDNVHISTWNGTDITFGGALNGENKALSIGAESAGSVINLNGKTSLGSLTVGCKVAYGGGLSAAGGAISLVVGEGASAELGNVTLLSDSTLTNKGTLSISGTYVGSTISQTAIEGGVTPSLVLGKDSVVNLDGLTVQTAAAWGTTTASGWQTSTSESKYQLASGGSVTNNGAKFRVDGSDFSASLSSGSVSLKEVRYNILADVSVAFSTIASAAKTKEVETDVTAAENGYYINILEGGTLTGVSDSVNVGFSGSGTIQVDKDLYLSHSTLINRGAQFEGTLSLAGGSFKLDSPWKSFSQAISVTENSSLILIGDTSLTGTLTATQGKTLSVSLADGATSGELTIGTGSAEVSSDKVGKLNGATLQIGDGVTVNVSGRNGGNAQIAGDIVVKGGGTLKLTTADTLGYNQDNQGSYDFTDRITLEGSSTTVDGVTTTKLAKLNLTGTQTLSTHLNLNGNSEISGSAMNSFDGTITASGSNNVISNELQIRKNLTITVNNTGDSVGSLELAGKLGVFSGFSGVLTKAGDGTLIISGSDHAYNRSVALSAGTLELRSDLSLSALTGSGTLKVTAGTATVTDASGFSGALEATGGNVELQSTAALTLSEVVVSGNSSITVSAGTLSVESSKVSIGAGEAGSLVGSLSISGSGTITLDASAGTTGTGLALDTTAFTGSLTLGSDLTLNLLNLNLKKGEMLKLFSGVGSCTFDSAVSTVATLSDVDAGTSDDVSVDAGEIFKNLMRDDFKLTYFGTTGDNAGIVALVAQRDVPEPTTATLSLLALMGLAARRRRRKA